MQETLEKAFTYDPKDFERPVKFGFDQSEREWLKMPRPYENIMDFIYENDLSSAVMKSAVFHEKFLFTRVEGEVRNVNGRYWFFFKGSDTAEFEVEEEEDFDFDRPQEFYRYIIIKDINDDSPEGWIFTMLYDDSGDEEYYNEMEKRSVIDAFIQMLEVDSYYKLGRIINEGQKNFNKNVAEMSNGRNRYGKYFA